jgi:uncharacterized protein (UPF0333 family)
MSVKGSLTNYGWVERQMKDLTQKCSIEVEQNIALETSISKSNKNVEF